MPKQVPAALEAHILPFHWDVRKVWALDSEPVAVPVSDFVYLLELPLWSSVPDQGLLFDVCPMQVIRDPRASAHQTRRLNNADLRYPIDVLLISEKRWILDGVHRIAKHFAQNHSTLLARFHDESVIPFIRQG
ncbi:hypothetical protein OPU71_05865 [Niveibacterium sp. 24ML]|uniref:hypothetical protein n=1 Tax=Niveibacterium sp. 24ML TaxID=2985512 RepID=UPI00226F060D|nr:hypothetical protein [Niveibacterium sp. 24ML]MCX9155649.1 hypothetical protein [Niveibacterium sp. 24ML]